MVPSSSPLGAVMRTWNVAAPPAGTTTVSIGS